MRDLSDVYAWIDAHADESIANLQTLLRQPSVAAQGVGMAETATLVEAMLDGIGADVRQVDVPGGYPVVYAELPGATAKTLSFYNHYDVQPAEPLDLWDSDPWAGEIRDGRIWARGVADNKGNIAARIAAITAWRAVKGELPLRLKFIIEGEEEIGSPHLVHFADAHADLIAADG
ncbi:MAG TPA: M20/M25/M40 family metallo-hydrolase, partial [Thermomicrobiales bacterium]|nr:M20/M25/M40 family metallo-hydrolase [Thermomicrobiales bacterium]